MAIPIEIPYYSEDTPLGPISGSTPFGYYDNDPIYQAMGPKFARFAARRLGYPIMEIELQDINFYAALEDATTVYGRELYDFMIKNNFLSLEGNPTGSNLNTSLIAPSLGNMIRLAREYGSNEVGSGGNINWYTGSINMSAYEQMYDLNLWASQSASLEPGDSIEVKRLFYEAPPAITRYFDPYAGTGTGLQSLMETFGFGQFSPGVNFMLMPIYFDVLKIQAIEFNDQIRKSAYSFELINNQLRIQPIPTFDRPMFFHYIKVSERDSVVASSNQGLITNISNVPYTNPVFSQINAVGIKWIYDYALAICKETLGNIRSIYSVIPIPGSEVTINGQVLIDQANAEKQALLEQLRASLNDSSRQSQMERKAAESEAIKSTFTNIPMPIYIRNF